MLAQSTRYEGGVIIARREVFYQEDHIHLGMSSSSSSSPPASSSSSMIVVVVVAIVAVMHANARVSGGIETLL